MKQVFECTQKEVGRWWRDKLICLTEVFQLAAY